MRINTMFETTLLNSLRQSEARLCGVQCHGEEQKLLGVADQIAEQPDQQAMLRRRVFLVVRGDYAAGIHRPAHTAMPSMPRYQPVPWRIAEQQALRHVDFMR